MQPSRLWLLLPLLLIGKIWGEPLTIPQPEARRLEVLFVGAPTENGAHHDPVTRYRSIKKGLGVEGIDFTYDEDPADAFKAATLVQYDAVLMYGNWDKEGAMPADQLKALTGYVEGGGAFLPVHCASACYGASPEFVHLVGGRFKSHETATFRVTNVNPQHPIMQGYPGFEAWDETYTHDSLTGDRTVLEKRGDEPWTWVREQGKGRVFYTAAGHDHRVWDLPEFQDLLKRAILWSVGPEKRKLLENLHLPVLEQEDVLLPGYLKHQAITRAQKPLSPQESMKLAQVPPGFEMSLFASEPDIVNPIFVTWDHRGRAWVIQTTDYPNELHADNTGHDKIIICEDTDGDGRADKFTTFADHLSIPTSLTFAFGGVMCTNGHELLFLKDTNGDDKADVREVLFKGFNTGDTHAGVSNLHFAPDGLIYATEGYAGFKGVVNGESLEFAQAVFRFRPDVCKLEVLQNTTNNTWGFGFNSDFDTMGSTANANPSFYLTFPKADYVAAGLKPPVTPRADDNPIFNPSSKDIRQVDQFDHYTAGAGFAFYTGTRFPAEWREKTAFVSEPTGKLVGIFDIQPDGAGFKAIQRRNNLYNSADAWSAPVCAEVGPDGAMWICDWYNLIVQHNPTPTKASAGMDATTGKGGAYETPLRDNHFGRIYRIYPKGTKNPEYPELNPKEADSLLPVLSHPDLFWRMQAERLLIENGTREEDDDIAEMIVKEDVGASHGLYAMAVFGAQKPGYVIDAMKSGNRALRRAGIRIATPEQVRSVFIHDGKVAAHDNRELAEVLIAMSRGDAQPQLGAVLYRLLKDEALRFQRDPTLLDAWQIAANNQAPAVLSAMGSDGGKDSLNHTAPNLLPNGDFSEVNAGKPAGWTDLRTYGGTSEGVKVTASPSGRDGSMGLAISSANVSDSGVAVTVAVKPHTRYRLAGWIRTKDLKPSGTSPGAMLNIHGGPVTQGVTGTGGWTQVATEFDSGDRSEVLVHCLFGGYGGATGSAWFDDVSLIELSAAAGAKEMLAAVAAHAREIGNPQAAAQVKPKSFPVDPAVHERGLATYSLTCIACHGPEGKGTPGAFPPLDGSEWATGDVSVPARIVMHGLQGPVKIGGMDFLNVMPPVAGMDDTKIAEVLTYVRQSWSNDGSPVTTEQVKAVRDQFPARTQPWTAAELGK
jgi:putative membrane-bound dehydrogenase-like protein